MPTNKTLRPQEVEFYASKLDTIIAVMTSYSTHDSLWTGTSLASKELSRAAEFADLPFEEPLSHVLVTPMAHLSQARDHLIAYNAVLRAEDTVMSLMTLLRTYFVVLAHTYYLVDPTINIEERVRRVLNVELESAGELMKAYRPDRDGYAVYDGRRRAIIAAGKAHHWHATAPEVKKNSPTVPLWWLGTKPPREMEYIRELMGFLDQASIPDDVYRLLSASTHAQPHALQQFIVTDQAQKHPGGYSTVPMGLTGRALLMWAITAVHCAQVTYGRCFELYGWSPIRWNTEVHPILQSWVALVRR